MLAATGKQIFLKVITNFDNYIPLNMPLEEHIGQVAEITQDFSGRHFLAGLLLAEVASGLAQVSSTKFTLLRQNISILRNILKKHEVDPRLNQDPKRMERIVSIYFPFILAVLEKFPDLRQTETRHDKEEAIQKEAFDNVWLCFFFVIKYCSKGILVEWWKKETQKRHIVFFELLLHCLQKFKGKTYEEEMGFTAVEAVALFMEHFEDDLQIPESPLLEKLFSLLQEVLASDQTDLLLATYSPLLRFVAHTFSKPLFDSSFSANSALIEVLNLAILRHCNFGDNRIRGAASGCFYLLLQKNFEVMGDIHRLNIQSTVAISRLVGESQLREYGNLNSSLNSIVQHAKVSEKSQHSSLLSCYFKRLKSVLLPFLPLFQGKRSRYGQPN
jgi:hypothetical protein